MALAAASSSFLALEPQEVHKTCLVRRTCIPDLPKSAMASTLLEQVVREAPCLIVIFDPAFRSTFVNDYGRRLIGHAASERAFSLFDLFEPDDRQAIRDVAIPSLLREGLWEGEYVCRWSGEAGRGVEVKWTLFLLRSAGDEIVGVGCVAADLTHRRNVERRLRESRARLKMASDLVGLSSYQWDLRSGALQWDDRLKALWGLPPGVEPTMDLWEQGVHPDDRQLARAAAEQVLDPAGEGFCDIQYRVIGVQTGPERWVRTYGQTQFEDGEAVVFVGAILDITEQRRAGAQLQRSEDRFRRFAENTGDVLWILNSDAQTLEYLSPAFRSVYGLEPQTAMLDMGVWSDCVHPDDRPIRAEALARVAEARDPITHEYRIVRPDGSVRKVQDTVFPIRDAEGRLSQIGGIAHDVSRRATVRVYIVDPEPREREARAAMLRKAGHEVTVFAAEDEFRSVAASRRAACWCELTTAGRIASHSLRLQVRGMRTCCSSSRPIWRAI